MWDATKLALRDHEHWTQWLILRVSEVVSPSELPTTTGYYSLLLRGLPCPAVSVASCVMPLNSCLPLQAANLF